MQWKYFLNEVLHTIEETLPHGMILMAFCKNYLFLNSVNLILNIFFPLESKTKHFLEFCLNMSFAFKDFDGSDFVWFGCVILIVEKLGTTVHPCHKLTTVHCDISTGVYFVYFIWLLCIFACNLPVVRILDLYSVYYGRWLI